MRSCSQKSLFIHVLFKYCNSSGNVYEVFHFLFLAINLFKHGHNVIFDDFCVLDVKVSLKQCSYRKAICLIYEYIWLYNFRDKNIMIILSIAKRNSLFNKRGKR